MFPSLPRNVIVAEVIRKITEFKANINKGVLIQLVRLSVKSMSFQMSNKFYQQADDLYTGCSSSPCFTKIYIQGCEEIMIHIMIQASVIWLHVLS